MTLLCVCAGADCACGRLGWLINFTRIAAEPAAPLGRRRHCPADPDDYFVLQPKES